MGRLKEHHGALLQQQTGLLTRAAGEGRLRAVRLCLHIGFPIDGDGGTPPLHFALWNGQCEVATELLAAGADPTIDDSRFNSDALGWARHGGHAEAIALVEPS